MEGGKLHIPEGGPDYPAAAGAPLIYRIIRFVSFNSRAHYECMPPRIRTKRGAVIKSEAAEMVFGRKPVESGVNGDLRFSAALID